MMKSDNRAIAWATSPGLTDYELAVSFMEDRAQKIQRGEASELLWLVEHPPLYTAGTSARDADLTGPSPFPVHVTGRGGQLTYHGPGQRVGYVMLDLKQRFGGDVRAFVHSLERWLIASLAPFDIQGETRADRVGVWVRRQGRGDEAKIAALGVRVRGGVSFHGVSLNVAPDLSHYDGIVPCGITEFGVTSLADLGVGASMKDVDMSLVAAFEGIFGNLEPATDPLRAPTDAL
jgi:lipoyl(octanoyl) transferase